MINRVKYSQINQLEVYRGKELVMLSPSIRSSYGIRLFYHGVILALMMVKVIDWNYVNANYARLVCRLLSICMHTFKYYSGRCDGPLHFYFLHLTRPSLRSRLMELPTSIRKSLPTMTSSLPSIERSNLTST